MSLVKHYKINPDGTLRFIGIETYPTPRIRNGRGRRVDPFKGALFSGVLSADDARRVSQLQYDGIITED